MQSEMASCYPSRLTEVLLMCPYQKQRALMKVKSQGLLILLWRARGRSSLIGTRAIAGHIKEKLLPVSLSVVYWRD